MSIELIKDTERLSLQWKTANVINSYGGEIQEGTTDLDFNAWFETKEYDIDPGEMSQCLIDYFVRKELEHRKLIK